MLYGILGVLLLIMVMTVPWVVISTIRANDHRPVCSPDDGVVCSSVDYGSGGGGSSGGGGGFGANLASECANATPTGANASDVGGDGGHTGTGSVQPSKQPKQAKPAGDRNASGSPKKKKKKGRKRGSVWAIPTAVESNRRHH